jgi:hypothetical protein
VGITEYGVVLFLHIGVVIIGFMIAAVLHASLHSLVRAKTVADMRPFAGLVHRLEPLLPISAVFILGFGAWLIHLAHGEIGWGDGWIVAALITLIAVEGLAGALLAPRTKKLIVAIEAAPDGAASAELRKQAADPLIWDIAHTGTLGFLGVVLVMTSKPSGGGAAAIVVIAVVIGIVLSRLQLRAAAKHAG